MDHNRSTDKLTAANMEILPKEANPINAQFASSNLLSEPTLTAVQSTNQPSRPARAQYILARAIPALQNKKAGLVYMSSDNTIKKERLLMAGCIGKLDTDILSHMGPKLVLQGLCDEPEYMVQLEQEKQHGDRCLYACITVGKLIVMCEQLLESRVLGYETLVRILEEETDDAVELEGLLLEVLKWGSEVLQRANKALEEAVEVELKETMKNPWGY